MLRLIKKALGIVTGVLLVLIGITAPAMAVDGVIEINQARALAGGVTLGDAPGFPVTINQPGSYRLTSNLSIDTVNVNGIDIRNHFVTIDLNGFAIAGPVLCSGSPTTCSPNSLGVGISNQTYPNLTANVSVFNGVVRGMGVGVVVGFSGRVEKVHATSNSDKGILAYDMSIVNSNTASHNGGHGILAVNSLVTNNTSYMNQYGLYLMSGGGYGGNIFNSNYQSQFSGWGVQLGTNVCNNSPCP